MRVSSHPEQGGSELNSDDEFLGLPLLTSPPQFIAGHLEDLEDALLCPDLPPAYHTDDSEDHSSEDSEGGHSDDSNDKHGSRHDDSDYHSQDDHTNDVYSKGYVKLQEQGMCTACCHLCNMQTKWELSHRKATERRGKAVEMKAKELEVYHECEARCQWKDREALFSGSVFHEGVTMSVSGLPESSGQDTSSDEGGLMSPQFVPGQLEDLEDALLCPKLQPDVDMDMEEEGFALLDAWS
uniref:Uncharacterized protein LOC110219761 n=1 Tax=Phascolarctos cinereus TaxID=38626 RepID=A0A6P5LT92_PHACI|nr:uncharacterized protein LOC110219761 [Phascolarctos cinereus]XP_020859073.1 uncharacterized protein LOC110219761 [Phascolarctos cinereus]XP_020859266.1 uncharacterized protein LOC110219887 [Phascolarctos cinereus]